MKPPREATLENGRRFDRFARLLAAVSLFIAAGIGATGEADTDDAATDGNQPPIDNYRLLDGASGAVVIVPGADEPKEAWVPIADSLRRSGLRVVLAVDGNGGGSTASRAEDTDLEVMDPQAAFYSLRDLPAAIGREATLVASGSGCSVALGVHEIGIEWISLVLLSPRGDWERPKVDTPAALWERPILVLAAKDDLLSIEASAAILQGVPRPECWIVDGRGRGAELLKSRPDLVSKLTAWITHSTGAPGEEP